jgi:hypothetical protein
MTVRSGIIAIGVLVIIWLGVTTAQATISRSHAISAAISGS